MRQYTLMFNRLISDGIRIDNRTGVETIAVFGHQERYDLNQDYPNTFTGFPLITTKKMFFRGIAEELLWFLMGDTNVKYLQDKGVHIWDEWADKDGELGPIYGKQWRKWTGKDGERIDQISNVIRDIKENPKSRRLIVSAWNPADVDDACIPPCHALFQFRVMGEKLSCLVYQRSADYFLGVPFNIASYALLTHMVAHVCGLRVGDLIHTIGDLHLYKNHFNQAMDQSNRDLYRLPSIELNPDIKDIFDFKYEDIKLVDYKCHPAISAPIAV